MIVRLAGTSIIKMRHSRLLIVSLLVMVIAALIQAQPTIVQQPSSQFNVPVGTNVTLFVVVQSTASNSLHYQWRRNGVLIPGATNISLTIEDIQATNAGAFKIHAIDNTGVVVSAPADVTVSIPNLPSSDMIEGAVSLSQAVSPIASDNTNAVKEAGTPDIIPHDPGGSEVWFSYSLPAGVGSGTVTFSTLGSDFDTAMGVYIGSSPQNLAKVSTAINDDDAAGFLNSQVSFYAEAGTTYLIAVDGFHGAQGNIVLSWTFAGGSLPDTVATPLAVTTSNGATLLLNVPWAEDTCDWFQNGSAVNSQGGVLLITNADDSVVGSYVAQLNNPNGIGDSSEPTLLQLNTLQDGGSSTNSMAWVKFQAAVNHSFLQTDEEVVKLGGGGDTAGFSCSQVYSTIDNVDEPGEPLVCGRNGAHASWYSYVTPSAGSLLVNTAGSSFNTVLGVFIGPGNSFSTLTNIGCGYTTNYTADGQPSVYVSGVPAGQTNYIVVEGQDGASGVVHLNIYLGTVAMSVVPTNGGLTFSWPSAAGTNLQVSTNLTDGWQPANLKVTTAGNTNSATAPMVSVNQFFRLMEPVSVFK